MLHEILDETKSVYSNNVQSRTLQCCSYPFSPSTIYSSKSPQKWDIHSPNEGEAGFGKTPTHHSEGVTTLPFRPFYFPQTYSKLAQSSWRHGTQSPLSVSRCLISVWPEVSIPITTTTSSTLSLLASNPLLLLLVEDQEKGELSVKEGVLEPSAHLLGYYQFTIVKFAHDMTSDYWWEQSGW